MKVLRVRVSVFLHVFQCFATVSVAVSCILNVRANKVRFFLRVVLRCDFDEWRLKIIYVNVLQLFVTLKITYVNF